jgi:hypothetical protein
MIIYMKIKINLNDFLLSIKKNTFNQRKINIIVFISNEWNKISQFLIKLKLL